MPQDSRSLFRLTLAATPAEATPDSTSAVLGHSQVQITREASHRADEVENVVLVACRDQLPKHAELLTRLSPHSLRLGRVVPVLPVGPAGSLQAFWCSWARAQSAMYATPPVRHCRLAARLAIALAPGSTSGSCVREVEMGSPAVVLRFVGHFLRPSP